MTLEKKIHPMADPNPFVIAIDFGSISIVHKNDPSRIFTIVFCKEAKCKLHISDEDVIYSELSNDLITIHYCEINKYLSDINEANKDLSKAGLNLKTVIIDYLKQSQALMIKSLLTNESFKKTKYFNDFKPKSFDYYISCAQPKVMKECFIGAGLIGDHEQHRLTFVPRSELAQGSYAVALIGLKPIQLNGKSRGVVRKEDVPVDFIVGIDFGTTFSGSSSTRLKSVPSVTRIVKSDCPGKPKFATAIMYEENDTDVELKYWGQEAIKNSQDIYGDLLFLDKFKLFMLPDKFKNETKRAKETYSYGNTPVSDRSIDIVQVISDYFKSFKKYIDEYINDNEDDVRRTSLDKAFRVLRLENKFNLNFILTVPDSWDKKSRDILVEAAEIAKLITNDQPQDSFMLTELRSVALYYVDSEKASLALNGDTFLICDAGGATVNVGTFRIECPNPDIKKLIQIGSSDSDTCGSMYINENFNNYIYQFYKDIGIHIDKTLLQFDSIEAHFVHNIKPNFLPEKIHDSHYNVNLPGSGSLEEYIKPEHIKKYRLTKDNRGLQIKNETIDKQMFDPVFKRIEVMLDKQMENKDVKTIVLVGGMSQSRYLQQRIKDRYKSKAQLYIPADYDSAISRGAALYGVNPKRFEFSNI